ESSSALVIVSSRASDQLSELPIGAFEGLTGGSDGIAPTADDYGGENVDPRLQTGLAALETDTYTEVAIVAAPGAAKDVVTAIIRHCEQYRFRFALIDTSQGHANTASLDPRSDWDTSFAA